MDAGVVEWKSQTGNGRISLKDIENNFVLGSKSEEMGFETLEYSLASHVIILCSCS